MLSFIVTNLRVLNVTVNNEIAVTGDKMEKATLTIQETGKILGIGRSAAYEAAKTGEIPTIRIGRRLLVPIVALQRKLELADQNAEG